MKEKKVLVSGASMAGLSTAYWMNTLGYQVTVVEIANEPRTKGAAVDIRGNAIDAVKRMKIFGQLKLNRLHVDLIEFKNADDVTEGSILLKSEGAELPDDEIEIERDKFVGILFDLLKPNVEFIFGNSIMALKETPDNMQVDFKNGAQREFELVIGCDGIHSAVRKTWFGQETEYTHFLGAYSAITILNKLLLPQHTMQMYNVPGKAIMLNAYNNKTDVIFSFLSEKEIDYDYRDVAQQREIILGQFAGQSWRTEELLKEVQLSGNFYFDKFCQIKMPLWAKGRVALVGDAGYCASPAAGMGASLAVAGAAALADALQTNNGNYQQAFNDYNQNLRPLVDEVQAMAESNIKEKFILKTEEAIRERNAQTNPW